MSALAVLDPPPVAMEPVSPSVPTALPLVARAIARPPADLIHQFPSQSPLLIVLLTSITSGLYLAIWCDRQVRVLSRLLPRHPMEPFWMPALWCLCGLSAGWFTIEYTLGLTLGAMFMGVIVSQVAQLACVLMAFQIRTRLNELLEPGCCNGGKAKRPFSGLGTFFGNAFYLQWKINKLRRLAPRDGCRHCGYNLTGLTLPRCPECGTSFDPSYHVPTGVRHSGLT